MQQARGQRLSPDHLYAGDNNAREALLSFWLGGEAAQEVSVEIRRGEETLHRFETTAEPGLNRTSWDLQWQGREIYGPLMSPDLERPLAAPGEYEVVLRAGEHIERAGLTLLPDPSVAYSAAAYADNHAFRMELEAMYRDMRAIRTQLACMHEAQTTHAGEADAPAVAALADAIDRVWSRIEYRDVQGTISDSPRLGHRLSKAFYYTHTPYRALTDNDHALLRGLRAQSTALARAFGALEQGPWQAYQAQVFMQGNRLTDCSGAAAGVDAE
jgi:hypothetical protein